MLKVMQAHMVVMAVPSCRGYRLTSSLYVANFRVNIVFNSLKYLKSVLSVWIGMIENWFWIGLQGHTSTKEPIRIPSCSFTEGYPVVPVLVQGG